MHSMYAKRFIRERKKLFQNLLLNTAVISCVGCFSASALAAYDKNYIGDMETYTAVYEDTLVHLARKNDLGFVEIRAANPALDPWIPGEGAEVILPKRHLLPDASREGIVINLPEMRIYAYLNGEDAPFTYPIGVGREGLDTPTGRTTIVRKKDGPIWHPTERMRKEHPELPEAVLPGPDNPMGTHALYLGWPTYAMHGTNRPFGIGRRVSSGCIRLYPEDIIKLFGEAAVGTPVNVIDEPIKVAWIGNELYLEAHPDLEQAIKMEEYGTVEQQKFTDEDMAYIMKKAGDHVDILNWPKIRTALRERSGYPVRIARYFEDGVETPDAASAEDGDEKSQDAVVSSDPEAPVPSQEKGSVVEEKDAVAVVVEDKSEEVSADKSAVAQEEAVVTPKEKPKTLSSKASSKDTENSSAVTPPVKPKH